MWKMVEADGMKKMPREWFVNNIMEMEQNAQREELEMWFDKGDKDQDGELSRKEFFALAKMTEKENRKGGKGGKGKGKGGKDMSREIEKMMEQGMKDAEEAWSRVTNDNGMGFNLFKEIWLEKDPEGDHELIWKTFFDADTEKMEGW